MENSKDILEQDSSKITKWRLVAGEEMLYEFCLDIFSIEDPLICIWTTEKAPDMEEVIKTESEVSKVFTIDQVRIYLKEQIHSLFFPNGFIKGKWNFVLVGINDGAENLQFPIAAGSGILCGWMRGTDIDDLTLTLERNFLENDTTK